MGLGNGEGLYPVCHRAVVDGMVEVSRHGVYAACKDALYLLVDVVAVGIEFSHGVAVYHVNVFVFARAEQEMLYVSLAVNQVRKHQRSTRAQVSVDIGLPHRVERGKVIGNRKSGSKL